MNFNIEENEVDENLVNDFKKKIEESQIPNDAREQIKPYEIEAELKANRNNDIMDLEQAKQKIRELEEKISAMEIRLPKQHPDVLYLNYKARKRILVTHIIFLF